MKRINSIKNLKIIKLFLLFLIEFNFFSIFPKLTFSNTGEFIALFGNSSGFGITNKGSIAGYKEQAIIKGEPAENAFLGDNQIWSVSSDTLAPEETFEFTNDLIILDGQTLKFSANMVFDGRGYEIILGKYAQLLVDGGVTVTFKNMAIKNTLNTISCPPIRCMDWYSKACFDNVIFAFNDDLAFKNGQFFIHNDVEFTGTSKFSYRSVRPSYIASGSNLIFDPQTTFEYYPSTTDNSLINMADKTSAIIFDGSILQTTHTGIRLTKGSLYFDNKITLSSVDNTALSGLSFILTSTEQYSSEYLAWSPNGRYLAVGINYSTVKVLLYRFDGATLTLTCSTGGTPRETRSIDWSPDGNYIAVGNRGASGSGAPNELYKVVGETLSLVFLTAETDNTWTFMWHPSGKYIAASNYEQPVRLYKLSGDALVLVSSNSESNQNIRSVWTPDGKYMISGSHYGGAYNIYQLIGETLTIVSSIPSAGGWICPAITPNGKYGAFFHGAGSSNIGFYRLSGTTLSLIYSLAGSFWQGSWSPDGHYFITADASANSRKVYRIDGEGITLAYTYPGGFLGYTSNTSWTPDGKFIAFNTTAGRTWVMRVNYMYDTSRQGYSNGIIFGNSSLGASYDADMYVLGGANVLVNGKVWYDDIN